MSDFKPIDLGDPLKDDRKHDHNVTEATGLFAHYIDWGEPLEYEEFLELQAKVPDLDLTKPWDILTAYGRACDTKLEEGLGRPDCTSLLLHWHKWHLDQAIKNPTTKGMY